MARRHHPWRSHLPPGQRASRALQLAGLRWRERLQRRRSRILLALIVYVALCLLPLRIGQPHLTLMALLPLLLVPPVGYLAYLLAWHEFHR